MNPRILEYLQNALLTAVTIVMALVVFSAFLRVIRPPDVTVSPSNVSGTVSAGTPAPANEGADGTTTTGAGGDGTTSTIPQSGDASVCREESPPAGSGTVLRVYYDCGGGAAPNPDSFVYRAVPETDLVLTKTLEEMVLGPDEEERALGFESTFSDDTTRAFASVRIADGLAIVDFTGLGSVEGIGAGPDQFLATINANVFQFDTISSAEYRLGGSCDAFYALIERECVIVTRQGWNQQAAEWRNSG